MMSKMLEEYKLLKANWNYWMLSASLRVEGQDGEILLPGWLSCPHSGTKRMSELGFIPISFQMSVQLSHEDKSQ